MGHHNRHFAGDPHALSGAWSPPTSAANFCEEDYAVTRYIAEFVNSLTNLAYVVLALRYMYGPGSRGLFAPRLDFMSVSLFGLGIASFLYHASLRQSLQFADDLSMLVLAWSFLQCCLTLHQSPGHARVTSAAVAAGVLSFSVFYVWSGRIIYHTIAFVVCLLVVFARMEYLLRWKKPGFAGARQWDWAVRSWKAVGVFVFGYVLWNIDLEFCAELRAFREEIGMPWSWALELHGWWHILTGVGASLFMDVLREMREDAERSKTD